MSARRYSDTEVIEFPRADYDAQPKVSPLVALGLAMVALLVFMVLVALGLGFVAHLTGQDQPPVPRSAATKEATP